MASVKIPMDSIEKISVVDPSDNSVLIEFIKPSENDIPHTIYIADSQWTLVVKDNMLLIEK